MQPGAFADGSADAENDSALQIMAGGFIIGTGCRKGAKAPAVREAFENFCKENAIPADGVAAIASIDIKRDEAALKGLADDLGVSFLTYSADELNDIKGFEGEFSTSDFVESVTGVDCVCERCAVKASGAKRLLVKKTVFDGVTFAAARIKREYFWSR